MSTFTANWNSVSTLLRSAFREISPDCTGSKPTVQTPAVLVGSEAEFLEFLEHNEFELAWDALAELGNRNGGRSFWSQLARAAREMQLADKAAEATRRAALAA